MEQNRASMTEQSEPCHDSPYGKTCDDAIRDAILSELESDLTTRHAPIVVEVRDGLVTFEGSVANAAIRTHVERIASAVTGVRSVLNGLAIALPVADSHQSHDADAGIRTAIERALEWNTLIPENPIEVTVHEGNVTLTGRVGTPWEREESAALAKLLPGVRSVDNRIEVSTPIDVAEKLRRSMTEALVSHARELARGLAIEVEAGTVTVRGSVDSIAEKRLLLETIGHTPSVHEVNDRLEIASTK